MIGKFVKNNPDIAVNLLFNSKIGIYAACKSKRSGKRNKQTNLLTIVDGKNKHYMAVKNISRFLPRLSEKAT